MLTPPKSDLATAACAQIIMDDVRPHPSPLPQERGNRTPRFVPYGMLGNRSSHGHNTKSVTATGIVKLFSDMTTLSLSPGERAGVRASVNFNSIKS